MLKKIFISTFLFLSTYSITNAITNPLKANDVPTLIGLGIKGLMGVVGSISLVMFIYGGMTWLTSGGSPEKIKNGKQTIIWAIFGLVAIFSGYAVIKLVFTQLAV